MVCGCPSESKPAARHDASSHSTMNVDSLLVESIAVRLEDAVLVLDEEEREGIERQRGAEPDEAGRAARRDRARMRRRSCAANRAVDAVGRDDQVGVAESECVESTTSRTLGAESEIDAQLAARGAGESEQLAARDAAEAVAARRDATTVDEDVDVVPVREIVGDRAERRLVGSPEILEGLVGKHDAPAERVVGPVSLENGDLVRQDRPA